MASRDLKDCTTELQEKWPLIKRDIELANPTWVAKPICTLRSTDEQAELFQQGRTKPGKIVTWIDGVTKIGAHNPIPGAVEQKSRAIDVGIFVDGKYMTDNSYYKCLIDMCKKYDLKSGWDFGDPPHIEILVGAVIRRALIG
jgi:peptidoglycan L-alanyl-D-glutamate endopeptidase CwlK